MVLKTMDGFREKILFKEIFEDLIYGIHEENNSSTGQNKTWFSIETWFFKTMGMNYFFMEI